MRLDARTDRIETRQGGATDRTELRTNARFNSFLLSESELDKCTVNLSFNSANVTAAKNFLVIGTFKTNSRIVSKAEDRSRKHVRKAISKFS